MAKREDGKETRARLLQSSLKLFSQKGYHQVTVADICKNAGANQASVNYYFGDKANLYAESWQYAIDRMGEFLFTEEKDASPEQQLEYYIRKMIKNFTENEEKGYFSRIYMMELLHPTGLIHGSWYEKIKPNREKLRDIISEVMQGTPSHETLLFCELSIISQCRNILTIKPDDLEFFIGQPFSQEVIERLAAHITAFSIAGIRGISGNEK